MAICGLVITLEQAPEEQALAIQALKDAPDVTLGEATGERIPAVLESAGKADYRQRWEELLAVPGVAHLDLTYVNYEF
jgi:hypothetical protein